MRRFQELLKYNGLTADLAVASTKEMILEIAGSGRIDLLVYYPDRFDEAEAVFLKQVRSAAPGLKILCLVQDDILEQVRGLGFQSFDDFIPIPLNSGDLCAKILKLTAGGSVEKSIVKSAVEAPPLKLEPESAPKVEVVVKVKKGLESSKEKGKGKGKGKGRRLLKTIARAAFILLLVFINLTAFFFVQSKFTGEAPKLFGYQLLGVLTGSMSPAIDAGSLILVRETDPGEIDVGEIITYRGSTVNSPLTTHRVIRIKKDAQGLTFITKGDRNNIADANPISEERILGVVERDIPYLGFFFAYAQSRQGLLLFVILPALMVIAYALSNIFRRNAPNDD